MNSDIKRPFVTQVTLFVALLVGLCISASQPVAAADWPDAAALAQAEYRLSSVRRVVRLNNGSFRIAAAPGSTSEVIVTLTQYIAHGELDGRSIAAAVLVTSTGGTGSFYDLAVMITEEGEPTNIATIFLGDRIRLQTIAVRGNEIVVELIRAGLRDPLCCTTQRVLEHYRLADSRLTRTAVQEIEPPDPRLLGGTWMLKKMVGSGGDDVPVQQAERYTLLFKPDWTVEVRADCNGAGGSYDLQENKLEIRITHSTLASCPPESRSDEWLRLLGLVASYRVDGGELWLNAREKAGALRLTRQETTLLPSR